MNKNGQDQQTTPAPQSVKFDRAFTPAVDEYIETCKKESTKVTVKGFANSIGVDQHTVWAWATKKRKNDAGELTEEFARPNFHAALTRLDQLEKAGKGNEINAQQELFCKLFASDREFFGNGVQAYIEAFNINVNKPGAYNGARASASRLLTDANILKRIDELMELGTLNDTFVDKQLAFVIAQNVDLSSKTAAIREYNKLKTRIITKLDHTTNGKDMPSPIYGGKATS